MDEIPMDGLGKLISTHAVDAKRRLTSGFTGVFLSAIGLPVLTYVLVEGSTEIRETTSKVWGWLLAAGGIMVACGIPLATVQLIRSARGGLRGSVELYRHGLVHRGRRTRSWTWDEITTVRIPARPDPSVINVHLGAGWEFRLTIRFADRAEVTIDGLAANYLRLAEYVVRRRPDAVDDSPAPIWRRLPFLITFFAIAFAGQFWYLIANMSRFDNKGYESLTTPFPEREFSLLMIGLFGCIFGLIFTVYAFTQRPRR